MNPMLKPISLVLVSIIGIAFIVFAIQNEPERTNLEFVESSFSGTITKVIDGDTLDFRIMNAAKEGTRRANGILNPPIGMIETVEAIKSHQHSLLDSSF